jgi:hypothetical protein
MSLIFRATCIPLFPRIAAKLLQKPLQWSVRGYHDENYTIFIDGDEVPDSPHTYQISICPYVVGGGASAMTYKNYPSREALEFDMRRYFRYTDRAILRFFASQEMHQSLIHALKEEDAAYFGWAD